MGKMRDLLLLLERRNEVPCQDWEQAIMVGGKKDAEIAFTADSTLVYLCCQSWNDLH